MCSSRVHKQYTYLYILPSRPVRLSFGSTALKWLDPLMDDDKVAVRTFAWLGPYLCHLSHGRTNLSASRVNVADTKIRNSEARHHRARKPLATCTLIIQPLACATDRPAEKAPSFAPVSASVHRYLFGPLCLIEVDRVSTMHSASTQYDITREAHHDASAAPSLSSKP